MNDSGSSDWSTVKKSLIPMKNTKVRLQFSRDHLLWIPIKWNIILFNDRSKFYLFETDGKWYVRQYLT